MGAATIRRLTADDAASLTALIERARDAGELLGSSSPHGDWIVRYATLEPNEVAVAEADGVLAGVVLPEIKALVVEPGFRRRGIGQALVAEGLEIERERGRPNLLLGLVPEDVAGHAFVEAAGFALHSTLWDLDLAPGVTVADPVWPAGTHPRPIDRGSRPACMGRAVQRRLRGPRDAAPARRRSHPGRPRGLTVPRRGPRPARGDVRRAAGLLRERAEAPARRWRGTESRDLDRRRAAGPPGPRLRAPAAALGRRAPARGSASRP